MEAPRNTPDRGLRRAKAPIIVAASLLLMILLTGCNNAGNGGTSSGSGAEGGQSSSQSSGKQSLSNLKSLSLAVMMYMQQHGETYPSMSDAAALKSALGSSVNESVLLSPDTKQPYSPNPNLSNKSLASVSNPAGIVLLYEPTATDGMRAVAYANGHAERVTEEQWSQIKQASGIP